MQDNLDFSNLSSPLANKIKVNGDEYLYFGGTAYLGIPQSEEFLDLYLTGVKKFGLNNGTSRSNNVQLGIYDEVEAYASRNYGSQSALITSSGYLAAQMVVQNLASFGEISYAPATHPALWLNEEPKVSGSFADWSAGLVKEINASEEQNLVIVSNSMNNLYPEIYDFSFIRQLNKNVLLVVDDSHGIGINNNGLSVLSTIPQCENVNVVVLASMAKALGVDAGIILGPSKIIAQLKNSQMFLGASPPAGAGLYAFMKAEKLYQEQLEKLKTNTHQLAKVLAESNNWHFVNDFPVFFYKNADLSAKLLQHKILVSSFPYPDKNGPTVNRIVLSSWHSKADIEKLIQAIT
ncbi:MAG: aminotransferase class I/II-fold pyridoxal phosphate-dependent enzyme [Pedobacter sp.]|nr:MAG: aminotransferase class I/II-fold pyridoxal phosphate-dependent enzyme [Pedobacter sp.]